MKEKYLIFYVLFDMLDVFTWFLILGKIKMAAKMANVFGDVTEPLAAPPPIKYRKTLDNNNLNQVGVQLFSWKKKSVWVECSISVGS